MVTLELTPSGERLVGAVSQWRERELSRIVAGLRPAARARLTGVLDELVTSAGEGYGVAAEPVGPVATALRPSLATKDSRHSCAVLAGLTSSTGGMVAAATTSLPERSKAGRNYDYRYVWIRDQCYAGQAVAADGPHRLLDDAVSFVADASWPTAPT